MFLGHLGNMWNGKKLNFKNFLEEKGNPRPTPQRKILPGVKLGCKSVMPSRPVPDPIRFLPSKKRIGSEVALVPKPDNIVPGLIKRPSDL